MSVKFKFGAACLAMSMAVLSGCASNPYANAPTTSASATVPKLKVVSDCRCNVPDRIPGLIAAGYAIAAHNAGKKISDDSEAVFTIVSFSERPTYAGLVIGGALTGTKDEIIGAVSYKGKVFRVDEYYVNMLHDIQDVASKVGTYAFNGLLN
ncbi:MAG: hypothetical protein EPO09_09540 [Aquabacterium sp.]|uniref:hypothetical protein n=1 Tax=Aquabacterium sp. TaxID=1872578 RepID=UPI0012273BE2|nr:hypothetical protein [Aquabacterium sp.]TAK94485.1 MAG: hypothetical protein EPO09_09540 [Aquabacterium sp.]